MRKQDKQKTTLVLPMDLMKKAKIRAIQEGRTLASIMGQAITEYLNKPKA